MNVWIRVRVYSPILWNTEFFQWKNSIFTIT